MKVRLVILTGTDRGRVVTMPFSPLVIGRGRESDTALNDGYVSRRHCQIELRGGELVLVDLGSSGGTLLNGRAVGECPVRPGDVIRVGETELRLEEDLADQATLVPPAPVGVTPTGDVPPLLPAARLGELSGHQLAHFRLGRLLARGHSGVLFLAQDHKARREVALKVLRPEFARDAASVQRFIRAMKAMLPLRHPNLITVHGAGKKGPYCWIAMEYVEGENLQQVIGRIGVAGMLDWRVGFRVAVHLARVLDYAHRHHIVHRNLTPANVMLQGDDKRVRLGDLMLAKAFEGCQVEEITRPGELIGDVRFMPTERATDPAAVDGRSDIYSLGALTYALLSGQAPFEGATTVETLTLIQRGNPTPPRKFQLSIPDAFQGAVLRMLARRPQDRFQTAGEVVEALERLGKFHGVSV